MFTPERRQSPRYRIAQGLLAVNPGILGPVQELSMHGMRFEYSGESLSDQPVTFLGLFAPEHHTLVADLQVRTVRDYISDKTSCFVPMIHKIRAVEFLNLTAEQKQKIKFILTTLASQ